jgi:NAD-dependent SIR2 family protein deacetylase
LLQITVDVSRVDHTLAQMTEQIKYTALNEVPYELTLWQSEDVHRRVPNVTQADYKSTVRFWSRGKRKKSFVIIPQLIDKLHERMRTMLVRELKWHR